MEKFMKNNWYCFLVCIILTFSPAQSQAQDADAKKIGDEITAALLKSLHCSTIETRVELSGDKSQKIKSLAIIINNIQLGQFTADRMTLLYENPVIDMSRLKKNKDLHFISYSKNKVNILASAESLERYFSEKAKQFNKKNVRISLKFTPPYVECF
jgi:hypothetical protein